MGVTIENMHYTNTQLAAQRELMERAQTDTEAFGEFFDAYYDKMLAYCLYRCGTQPDAEEVVSTIFFKALAALPRYRWTGVPIDAWLYRIAAREVVTFYRYHRNTVYIETEESWDTLMPLSDDASALVREAETAARKTAQYDAVQQALHQLPPRYQEIITLRFQSDLRPVDIAIIIGKPEGTVRSLISRALARLRKNLQHFTDFDVMTMEGKDQ